MAWSFRLTERFGTPIGEVLNASERKCKIGIKQVDTASFKIRADNELLYNLLAEDTLLQVWQDNEIRFVGPVVTSEYASSDTEEDTVVVNAVSPAWYWGHRLVGKSPTGTAYVGWDKGAVVQNMLEYVNGQWGTLVQPPAGQTTGTVVNYTAGPYKPLLTCLRDLSSGFDGFDWQILPLAEPITSPSTYIAKLDLAAIIGENKPDAVFEYGTGLHNMRGMTYKRDLSTMVNDAYHLTDAGAGDPAGVIEAYDIESIEKHLRFESVIESGGLTDATLRTQWAQENVNVRKVPRLIATMTSDIDDGSGRTPRPWRDYAPGDLVPMRAKKLAVQLFAGTARCYSIEIAVDQAGLATYTPTLVEEEGTGGESS